MDVSTYILQQKPVYQAPLQSFRKIILEAAPSIQEHIKYGVPFYTYYGMLCYLNVSGKQVKLGFWRGIELDAQNGLLTGNGKQVRHICVSANETMPVGSVREIIQEALLLNELHKKIKKA